MPPYLFDDLSGAELRARIAQRHGRLSEEEVENIVAHREHCDDCRREIAILSGEL